MIFGNIYSDHLQSKILLKFWRLEKHIAVISRDTRFLERNSNLIDDQSREYSGNQAGNHSCYNNNQRSRVLQSQQGVVEERDTCRWGRGDQDPMMQLKQQSPLCAQVVLSQSVPECCLHRQGTAQLFTCFCSTNTSYQLN